MVNLFSIFRTIRTRKALCNSHIIKIGFTLIEIAIVLVIVWLVAGGILVGRDLIRQAEIRSAISDKEQINASVNTFKEKYNCIPGDCANATDFLPAATVCPMPTPASNNPSSLNTCNGDGNGEFGSALAPSYSMLEKWLFWQHLYGANLIWGGPFSGFYYSYWLQDGISPTRTNVPKAHSGIGAFTVHQMDPSLPLSTPESSKNLINTSFRGRVIMLGGLLQNNLAYGPIFTPTEMLGIDTKLDDGKPDSGNILMYKNTVSFGYAPTDGTLLQNCVTGNVVGSSEYNTASSDISCDLIIKAGF